MLSNENPLKLELFKAEGNFDNRGLLSSIDFANLPFKPERIFWVSDVPTGVTRGNHFHKECNQILICKNGRLTILVRNNQGIGQEFCLIQNEGLSLPTLHYVEINFEDHNSELLVLADRPYDPDDVYTIDQSSR